MKATVLHPLILAVARALAFYTDMDLFSHGLMPQLRIWVCLDIETPHQVHRKSFWGNTAYRIV